MHINIARLQFIHTVDLKVIGNRIGAVSRRHDMSKRDEFIEKLKGQLDQLNEQLGVLEQKAQKATGEAREEYQRQVEKLREMAKPATDKLAELRSESEEHWHGLESEAERIYKAFVHSFNYFKSQLRKTG